MRRFAWRSEGVDVAAGLVLIAAGTGIHFSHPTPEAVATAALVTAAGCLAFMSSIVGMNRWISLLGDATVAAAAAFLASWAYIRGDGVASVLTAVLSAAILYRLVRKSRGVEDGDGPSLFRLAAAVGLAVGGAWHLALGFSGSDWTGAAMASLGAVSLALLLSTHARAPRFQALVATFLASGLTLAGAERLVEGRPGSGAGAFAAALVVLLGEARLLGSRAGAKLDVLDRPKRRLVEWERIGEYWLWVSALAIAVSGGFRSVEHHWLFHLAFILIATVSIVGFRLPSPETAHPRRTLGSLLGVTVAFAVLLASTGGYRSPFVAFGYMLVFAGSFALPPGLVLVPGALLLLYLGVSFVSDPDFPYQPDFEQGGYGLLILVIVSAYALAASRSRMRQERELLSANAGLEASLKAGAEERARLERSAAELGGLNKNLLEMRAALMNVLEDVEESKREIERDRRRVNASFDALGEGVVAAGRDGRVFLCNPAAARLLGKDVKDIVGSKLEATFRFFQVDSVVLETGMIVRAFAGEGGKLPPRLTLLRDDESRLAVEGAFAPFLDEENRPAGVVLIVRDVSVEREIEQQKSDFITVASHQLRTPISAIRWFLDLLLSGDAGPLKAQQKEFMRDMHSSSIRMSRLIDDLLSVSRIESGKLRARPGRVAVREIVDPICREQLPFVSERKIRLEIGASAEGTDVFADAGMARQVLSNVLSNAVKYTPEGGSVSVVAERRGDEVAIEVIDTGVGIPASQQHRVFSKFFRAENVVLRETVGTGIGLYIAKSLAESNGGRLRFSSGEGKGTTFTFFLPAADASGRMGA